MRNDNGAGEKTPVIAANSGAGRELFAAHRHCREGGPKLPQATRPLKLAVFLGRSHALNGAQLSLLTLLRGIDRTRLEAQLVTTASNSGAEAFREAGIPVEVVSLGRRANAYGGAVLRYNWHGRMQAACELLIYNLRIAWWLLHRRIDAVYANEYRDLIGIALPARMLGLPVIWYVRIDGSPGLVSNSGIRLAQHVITIADGIRRRFSRSDLRRYAARMVTLYTGYTIDSATDLDERSRNWRAGTGFAPAARLIGCVALISPRKAQDALVAAAPAVLSRHPDARFVLVGEAGKGYEAYQSELRSRIESAGLRDKFYFTGRIDDVAAVYRALDLVVLPSRSEGLPRVVGEALGYGRPVVATDVGGVREFLVRPEFGRVVPVDDTKALADAIVSLLNPGELSAKRIADREEFVRRRFSLTAYVRGFEGIVKSAVFRPVV